MTTNVTDDASSNMSDDVFEDPETTQRRIEDRRRNEYANADYYARSSAYADGLSYDRDYCAQHLGSGGQSLRDSTHRTASPSGYPGYRPPREAVLMYAFGEPGYKDDQFEEENYCDGWKSYKYDDFEPPFDDTVNHKTILLGDSGVGKTSFLVKYNTGEFRAGSFSATVGIALTRLVETSKGLAKAAKMRRRSLGSHCGNPSATSYSTATTSTGSNLCRRASLRKPPSPVHRDSPFERRESLVKPTWPNIKPGQLSPKTLEKVNGIGDDAECGNHHQHHHRHHHQQQQQRDKKQVGGSSVGGGGGGGAAAAAAGGSGSTSTGYESVNESSDSSDESSCRPLRSIISVTRRYSSSEEILAKVMLLGDSGVGKTCLLIRFRDGKFLSGNYITTVGIDFRNKVVMVDSTRVKLQIWDTAGQERFRSVTHAYYRDAHALLLLYDVTNKTSFDNTRAWLVEIREYAQDDVVIMLLGNKADCSNSDRQVKREDGERLAREYNVAFMETSAKTGLNVELAFLAVARQLKCRRNECIDEAKFNVQDFVREQTQVKQTCSQCSK